MNQIARIRNPKDILTIDKHRQKKFGGMNLEKLGLGFKELPQAQRATAFHFLISKRLGFLVEEGPALLEASPTGTMGTSESKVAISWCDSHGFRLIRSERGKPKINFWSTHKFFRVLCVYMILVLK